MKCQNCGQDVVEDHPITICKECLDKIIDKLTPEQMDDMARLILRESEDLK